MSPESPTKVLTASNLRALQSVATTTSAPVAAAATPIAFSDGHPSHSNGSSNRGNLVLSAIPTHTLFIQQQQQQQPALLAAAATTSAAVTATNGGKAALQTLPKQHHAQLLKGGNGLRTTSIITVNSNSGGGSSNSSTLNSLLAAAAAASSGQQPASGTFMSTTATATNNGIGGNMPASSKYVFMQQNGNGQYTVYDGSGGGGSGGCNDAVASVIVPVTEPLEIDGSGGAGEQAQSGAVTVAAGDNDEELRPLNWLSDRNLIKDINAKRNLSVSAGSGVGGASNIYIINASDAHELIEELPPPHVVASEEHVVSTSTSPTAAALGSELPAETQITTLGVNDYQQQFIASHNKPFGVGTVAGAAAKALTQPHQQPHHVYNTIPPIGATTTVHVGPSGTTTVVEYKTNASFMSSTQRQLLAANASSGAHNTAPSSTNMSGKINGSSSSSNYVPSTMTAAFSSAANISTTTTSPPATSKHLPLTSALVTSTVGAVAEPNNGAANGNANVTIGNSSTAPQGQQQQQLAKLANGSGTTTHHPHKKYLREKMNVLVDHGGGAPTPANGQCAAVSPLAAGVPLATDAAAITIVSSPASSANSLSSAISTASLSSSSSSSAASTSSSTGAVNGGNSPVSKTAYYPLSSSSGVAVVNSVASLSYTSQSTSAAPSTVYVNAPGSVTTLTASTAIAGVPTTYTIVTQGGSSGAAHLLSSAAVCMPEQHTVKEYYALATPQQLQQQLQQHQQQQQVHAMRSPTSYSSYDNDSLKDFDVSTQNSTLSSNCGSGGAVAVAASARSTHHTHVPQQQSQQSAPKSSVSSSTAQKQKHPNNYDPLVHTHNKPPYSFSSLIFMAIEGSTEKALPVKEIYAWIVQHFPYFKTAPTGWKNSVRHNLSLNKSFVKVEKAPNMGKGSLWRVEQQQRQNLIQALTRSPLFPNSAIDKNALNSPGGVSSSDANSAGYDTMDGGKADSTSAVLNRRFDPRIFPKLSRAVESMTSYSDGAADNDMTPSDYSAAANYSHHNNNNNNDSHKANSKKYSYSASSGGSGVTADGGSGDGGGGGGGGLVLSSFSIECLARDCGADSMDDVNAAAAMLALKHGPKVFTETFQNGAPVITSSPSEDHTYSAGGSGASTPLTNGQATVALSCNTTTSNGGANGCADNQSNCASSDAAYESSEENHNNNSNNNNNNNTMSQEELNDRQRQRDGVDALLSLSLSTSCSPIKRPASTSTEDEHNESTCNESSAQNSGRRHYEVASGAAVGKMALLTSAAANAAYVVTSTSQQQQRQPQTPQQQSSAIVDEGYHTQSYYGSPGGTAQLQPTLHHHYHHHVSTPSPPKRPKPCRSLRPKFKRKTAWTR